MRAVSPFYKARTKWETEVKGMARRIITIRNDLVGTVLKPLSKINRQFQLILCFNVGTCVKKKLHWGRTAIH